ncbi:hypothetical protein AMECASPLE_007685, partial [Ameca splendens]
EGNLLVYFMAGSLIGLVLVLLMFFVYTLNTSYQAPEPERRFPDPTTHRRTVQGTSQVTDSLDFASVDVKTYNSPRTKKSSN